jgi:hypothetical protein
VPPFVGVAVKLTAVPEQTVVALAAMLTDGVTPALITMVTELLETVVVLAQAALLVKLNVITSPFTKTSVV